MIVIYLIIALSILIFVHEFGHFIAARFFNIRVEKFSIGFGPKIAAFKKGETEYRISMVPFGGYVKMSGDEIGKVDRDDPAAFYNKPVWQRALVVLAGPFMNVVFSVVLMPLVFFVGFAEPAYLHQPPVVIGVKEETPAKASNIEKGDVVKKVDGRDAATWGDALERINIAVAEGRPNIIFEVERAGHIIVKEVPLEGVKDDPRGIGIEPLLFIANEAVLDKIVAGSPADKAGLEPSDRVFSVDGKPVSDWTDMLMAINGSGGREILVKIGRGEKVMEIHITPTLDKLSGRYTIGVQMDYAKRGLPMTTVRYGVTRSIKLGMERVQDTVSLTFFILGKLFTGQLSYRALGGPIGIAKVVAVAAKYGIGNFIMFLGFLSFQLGILNLLPIPVLDGGHLVFFGVEAVRGRPLGERAMMIVQNIGLAIILLLITIVTINDMRNIEFFRQMINRFF